jgi:hypothetical protein
VTLRKEAQHTQHTQKSVLCSRATGWQPGRPTSKKGRQARRNAGRQACRHACRQECRKCRADRKRRPTGVQARPAKSNSASATEVPPLTSPTSRTPVRAPRSGSPRSSSTGRTAASRMLSAPTTSGPTPAEVPSCAPRMTDTRRSRYPTRTRSTAAGAHTPTAAGCPLLMSRCRKEGGEGAASQIEQERRWEN